MIDRVVDRRPRDLAPMHPVGLRDGGDFRLRAGQSKQARMEGIDIGRENGRRLVGGIVRDQDGNDRLGLGAQ